MQDGSETAQFKNVGRAVGIIALLSLLGNHIWNFAVGTALHVEPLPANWTIAVTMASILPVIIAGVGYLVAQKVFANPDKVFTIGSLILTVLSLLGTLSSQLPDGTLAPQGFTVLTMPMHIISGVLVAFGFKRLVR